MITIFKNKIKKEILIGFIATLSLGFAYWGFTFLKAKELFNNNRRVVVIYDRIAGLNVSNPVLINGFKIGHVTDIYLLPNDSLARIVVKFQLSNKIDIPKNSIAKIESDLLGTNKINIIFVPSDGFIKSGDTLRAEIATTIQEEVSQQMLPIKMKAEEMMSSLDSILVSIRYIFNRETQESIGQSFKNIQATIESLKSTSYNLDTLMSSQKNKMERIVTNIETISQNFASNSVVIDKMIHNFANFSDSLAAINLKQTLAKADRVLSDVESITYKINNNQGSLGLLVNDKKLYEELEATAKQMKELSEDIKLNPHRYINVSVFGKSKNKVPYEGTPATK